MRALQAENLDEIIYVMFIFNILFNNIITVMLGIVKVAAAEAVLLLHRACERLLPQVSISQVSGVASALLMLLYYCSK